MNSCSKSSKGGGNIETPLVTAKSPKYLYDFVLNNYTDEEVFQIKELLPRICKKALFGFEVGESGTPHLQGSITLKVKDRMTGLLKHECLKRCSFRETRNAKALDEYCRKGGNIWTYGYPKPIKIITDLYDWQKDIEKICLSEPDGRTIHWYWEENGNRGKSAFCKYMNVRHNATIVRGGKLNDIMNIIFNTDMDLCRCIIFDIPRGHGGKVSTTSLEAISDGLITNTKYETGCKVFNPPNIVVFANSFPEHPENLSQDRWKITNLGETP